MKVFPSRSLGILVFLLVALSTGAWQGRGGEATHLLLLSSPQRTRLVTVGEGNEARYRVREQLANIDFPSDAVGVTTNVTGVLVLEADGSVVREESHFVVDLTTLKSDSERRDNFVRRNTLETDKHPNAEFLPNEIRGLPSPLPATGELTVEVMGDLTVHGITQPVSWRVTARAASGGLSGSARTTFTFADFGMTIPRVRSVLSVKDEITLEYDFFLIVDAG